MPSCTTRPVRAAARRPPRRGKDTHLPPKVLTDATVSLLFSPGVTRDRRYTRALWCGREFMCIDTGGLMELPGQEASSLSLSKCAAQGRRLLSPQSARTAPNAS